MGLSVMVNGRERALEQPGESCSLSDLIAGLELKPDRVAVELNGAICSRAHWDRTEVRTGDRLEIVHFVGGGLPHPPGDGLLLADPSQGLCLVD